MTSKKPRGSSPIASASSFPVSLRYLYARLIVCKTDLPAAPGYMASYVTISIRTIASMRMKLRALTPHCPRVSGENHGVLPFETQFTSSCRSLVRFLDAGLNIPNLTYRHRSKDFDSVLYLFLRLNSL